MRTIYIVLKDGNGNPYPLGSGQEFGIEEQELERLKEEFISGDLSRGVYSCTVYGNKRDLFLDLGDILAIY